MTRLVRIGPSVVRLEGSQHLPQALRGLCRADAPGAVPDAVPDAVISVVHCDKPAWPLDVSRDGDAHIFGRPRHAMKVLPAKRELRLSLCDGLEFNDVYWLQRDIFGALACLSGGLMLHASAVRGPDGRGYIFCGPSGMGKSTMARLLQREGLPVINDEVNWLFETVDGELVLVNQRYWMEDDENEHLPVGGLYVLRQGADCALHDAPSQAEVFTQLIAAHLSIDTEGAFLQARSEALARLIRTHPIPVLEFNLDTAALAALLWNAQTSPRA